MQTAQRLGCAVCMQGRGTRRARGRRRDVEGEELSTSTPISKCSPYCSIATSRRPTFSSQLTGARSVTVTTPGARPMSIEPVIVAPFLISGTPTPKSAAARSSPLWVAVEVGARADEADRQRLLDGHAPLLRHLGRALAPLPAVSGCARNGRSSLFTKSSVSSKLS